MPESGDKMDQSKCCVPLINCSRDFVSVRIMFLQFYIILSVISVALANCRFPNYLKPDALWTANYQNDGSFRGYFQEDNQGGVLKASRCTKNENGDGEACVQFRRKCLSKVPNSNKYEVQHTPYPENNEPVYYMCMEFIRRSNSILQLKESQKLLFRQSSLCDDENLTLDHWPLVTSEEFFDQKELCPFSGGYNLRFFSSTREPICPQKIIPPRLESECEPGDGLTINFRHGDCKVDELNMDLEMSLHCVASWTHERFTFVILKPQKNNDFKAWCLRLTGTGPNMIIEHGHLFTDFVCDPGDGNGNIRLTSNYLYIEFEQQVISSMCVDHASICEEKRLCKHAPSSIHCPKSCGFCEGDPSPCSFPEELRGSWVDTQKDKKKFINITYYGVSLTEAGRFQCFEKEGHNFENDTMLLQTFDNGCFHRFACLQKFINITYYGVSLTEAGRFQCFEKEGHNFENDTMLLQSFDNGCFPRFACLQKFINITYNGVSLTEAGRFQCFEKEGHNFENDTMLLQTFDNGCFPRFACLQKFINITYYGVSLTEAGRFQCFEKEGHNFENDTMLLQTFDNGCFPRFACLQKFINITYYGVSLTEAGRFQCFEKEGHNFENDTMLLQTFDNGCFPRFACLQKFINITYYGVSLTEAGRFQCFEKEGHNFENDTTLLQTFDNGCFPRFACLQKFINITYYGVSLTETGRFQCFQKEGHNFENDTMLLQTFDNGCFPRFACLQKFINITYYGVSLTEAGRFQCFEKEGHNFENDTMLLQTFDNGCFPRFACLQVNKPSSSTIEYRLGNRISWPVSDMKNRDNLRDVVCKERQFRPNTKDKLLLGKQINEKPSKILVDTEHHHHAVDCELNRWRGFSETKLYVRTKDCDSCLYYNGSHPKTIIENPWNCTEQNRHFRNHYYYRCLAVFPQDESTHAVLTRTLHTHQEYMCWVFLFESDGKEELPVIYILDASNCNQVAIEAVKNKFLDPNKILNIPKRPPRRCPNINHIITTTTRSPTPERETYVIQDTPGIFDPTPSNDPEAGYSSGGSNGVKPLDIKYGLLAGMVFVNFLYTKNLKTLL